MNTKSTRPTLQLMYQAGEDAIASSINNGDPVDYLGPFMDKHGLNMNDIDQAFIDRHKCSFYEHMAQLWEDAADDSISDTKRGHIDSNSFYYNVTTTGIVRKNNPWR
jgi:hypothetical protein